LLLNHKDIKNLSHRIYFGIRIYSNRFVSGFKMNTLGIATYISFILKNLYCRQLQYFH